MTRYQNAAAFDDEVGPAMPAPRRTAPQAARGLPLSTRAAFELLSRLRHGTLTVRWTDGREFVFEGAGPGESATVEVRDERAPWRILRGGAMALGESYMDGWLDTPDLKALLRLGSQNFVMDRSKALPHSPRGLLLRMEHALKRNTKAQARRNISAHYDLGNDFYSLWLDPSLTYSSALFDSSVSGSLEDGQERKRARLLELLDPAPGSNILEIGCGWGAFAIQAARERGCRVTGISISHEQCELARTRVKEAGVEDLVEIRMQDYRDVTERFDHVASIEMFEAVGEEYWPAFFDCVRDRLRPHGSAALQVITVPDWDWESYRSQIDFTQKYVFPGGIVPCPRAFTQSAERSGLRPEAPFFFGRDYARTLATWLDTFDARADGVGALGFDERFRRMWRFYLAWCNAGFASGYIDVMQTRLTRAG
jgi:cyclopropane-fatty-acyl-phospholipid synthase